MKGKNKEKNQTLSFQNLSSLDHLKNCPRYTSSKIKIKKKNKTYLCKTNFFLTIKF